MFEGTESNAETFVVEQETQLDGSPAPPSKWLRPPSAGGRLAAPAMVALAEGVTLLVCFLALPWFFFPQLGGGGPGDAPFSHSYTGWSVAQGLEFGQRSIPLFVHLWLVPLVAAVLLVLAWISSRGKFSPRLMLGMIVALSVLALLVELGYCVQVDALFLASNEGSASSANIFGGIWGCWVAVAVNVAALARAAYLLRASGRVA